MQMYKLFLEIFIKKRNCLLISLLFFSFISLNSCSRILYIFDDDMSFPLESSYSPIQNDKNISNICAPHLDVYINEEHYLEEQESKTLNHIPNYVSLFENIDFRLSPCDPFYEGEKLFLQIPKNNTNCGWCLWFWEFSEWLGLDDL